MQSQLSKYEEIQESGTITNIVQHSQTRTRRPGAGRKSTEYHYPNYANELEKRVEPLTKGAPESPIRWTVNGLNTLSGELFRKGIIVSPSTVMSQLHKMGYSLKSNSKVLSEGNNHPDRNAQFENIYKKATEFINSNNPVISVDTKKKEILGNFKKQGKQWTPKKMPIKVNDHDFAAPDLPRALPYGVYDFKNNMGHVTIGADHDKSVFAANSIYDSLAKTHETAG